MKVMMIYVAVMIIWLAFIMFGGISDKKGSLTGALVISNVGSVK